MRTNSTERIPELDGIRGLAILLILVFHGTGILEVKHTVSAMVQYVMSYGWMGVDLFFVLSGFLITGILLDCRGRLKNIWSFYGRRVLRIFPIYYATLAVMFLIVPLFIVADQIPGYRYMVNHQHVFWLYVQNWLFAYHDRLPQFPYVSHLWSLAIEEQFYLLWPAVVYFGCDKSLKKICTIIMVGSLLFRIFLRISGVSWFGVMVHTFARFDTLAYGCFLAIVARNPTQLSIWAGRIKRIFLPLTLLTAILLLGEPKQFHAFFRQTVGFSLVGINFAALILFVLTEPGTKMARWLRHPLMRFFGKYSYAIYIVHAPVYSGLRILYSKYLNPYQFNPELFIFFNLSLGIILSVALALLSWNLIEKHFLKLKDYFPQHP